MKITTIIFDLGGVLIDWNPSYVFDAMFDSEEEKKHFFENICTPDWNEMQDAGRPLQEATDLLVHEHPGWEKYIRAYYGRWEEMLGGPLQETVEIFRSLKEKNQFRFYALTNWSAELFPIALERYDFLSWFDGRLVSGEEKMRKPSPEFYNLLLERFNIKAEEAVFIDDNARNIYAAQAVGLKSIKFEDATQLKEELVAIGVG